MSSSETCGFIPPTPGYAPCTRAKGHDGPCAHPYASVTDPMTIEPMVVLTYRLYQPSVGAPAIVGEQKVGYVESVSLAQHKDVVGYRVMIRMHTYVKGQITLPGDNGTATGVFSKTDLALYANAVAVLQFSKLDSHKQAAAVDYATTAAGIEASPDDQNVALYKLGRLLLEGRLE